MAYGTLKEFYTQHFGEPNTVALLCCGGISGALAQTSYKKMIQVFFFANF